MGVTDSNQICQSNIPKYDQFCILGKMVKTCMKITKSTFWGQNSGGHGGYKSIFGEVGGSPQSPPLGETLPIAYAKHKLTGLKTTRNEVDPEGSISQTSGTTAKTLAAPV